MIEANLTQLICSRKVPFWPHGGSRNNGQ